MSEDSSYTGTRRTVLKGIGAATLGAGMAGSATASVNTVVSDSERLGPVTPHDTIYQILVDRFSDGDPNNNDFSDFDSSLVDGTGKDLKLYQGGDWQGIIDRIPYLVDMGISAVWISAPNQNREERIEDEQDDGSVDVWTSYHGYHAKNYFSPHRFFGDMGDFEAMRDALHNNDIKLVVDFVSNHTSRWQNPTRDYKAEHGRLYEPDKDTNGNYVFDSDGNAVGSNLLADPHGQNADWFHNLGDPESGDTSRFAYRYNDLASLADFNHEYSEPVSHLIDAAQFWKGKGVDGFRHDATLHTNPAFSRVLKDAIDDDAGGPITHFGEFFISRPDPKYGEYESFPDRTGINNLDFEYMRAQTSVFGDFSETMTDFGQMLIYTTDDYTHEHQAINFVDNHDVGRFRLTQQNDAVYNAALAAVMTVRGTPKIYYGTEQYVDPDGDSPNEGRVYMEADYQFDKSTTAYNVISKLASLRKENLGLAYGQTFIRHDSDDVIVFERSFYDHDVVVAINRQPDQSESVPSVSTELPDGTYTDELDNLLGGGSIDASGGTLDSFTLGGGEVNVWASTPSTSPTTPRLGTLVSTMGSAGQTVYLYGEGLGTDVTVEFGGVEATVNAGSENHVEVVVPNAAPGEVSVTASRNGQSSNDLVFTLLSGAQTQVVFHVNAETAPGENVHVVGNVPELGAWDPSEAPEAMHNPNYPEWFLPVAVPTDTQLEFKFVKMADDGTVTWESGSNRTFTSPPQRSGVGSTPTYDWRS